MLTKLFTLLIFSFYYSATSAQNLSGVYSLAVDYNSYYVNFKDSNFTIVSFVSNPTPDSKAEEVIKELGTGVYRRTKENITFIFDSTITKFNFYIADSLSSNMQTNPLNNKLVEVNVQYHVPEFKNTYLIIEGYFKEYPIPIKKGRLVTEFPDSISIKNIFISVMGYGKRELPFIEHYNSYKYDYFLNDGFQPIEIIKSTTWTFPISSQNNETLFRFNKPNNYLNKLNEKLIPYLKRISGSNAQIKKVTEGWFEE